MTELLRSPEAVALDLQRYELRVGGNCVKLERLPMELLILLVEKRGELVARDAIVARLWGNDVFVDVGQSINSAIRKVRRALNDDPDHPRFVETVVGMGYRFVGPIDVIGEPAPAPLAANGREAVAEWPVGTIPLTGEDEQRPPAALPTGLALEQNKIPVAEPRPSVNSGYVVVLGALVLALAVSFVLSVRTRPEPPKILGSAQLSNSAEDKHAPLLSDGSRFYFSQGDGGRLTAAQLPIGGGESVSLTTPLKNVIIWDISPDGSELLAGNLYSQEHDPEATLWILPVLGGSPHRVGQLRAHSACWSPDGRKILYATGNDLNWTNREGSDSQKFLTAPGLHWDLRWSPDGKTLRFSSSQGGNGASIWEAAADGSQLRPLLPAWHNPPQECCGNWTADGKYYVFESTRNGLTSIWAIREMTGIFDRSSGKPVQLTTGPMSIHSPLPSRDGRRLYVIGEQRLGELVRYDFRSKQFVPYLGGISAEGAMSSRDGRWVAYVSYPEGSLWRSRADGTERLQLTQPPLLANVPVWSPDGKQIAFIATRAGTRSWKTYLIPADGGTPQRLTTGEDDEFAPVWSPDGNQIVFGGLTYNPGKGLRMIDLRTHQISLLPGGESFCCPAWSLDGRFIVATTLSPARLMLFDVAARKWSELRNGPSNYYDWSHDSKYVYFDTELETDPGVFRIRVSDRKVERVASLRGIRRTSGPMGDWLDVTPDDSPVLLRNLGNRQIYALDWHAP